MPEECQNYVITFEVSLNKLMVETVVEPVVATQAVTGVKKEDDFSTG